MEQFTCLKCGHRGSFDPRSGPAVCPQCGYTPPMDRRVSMMDFDELQLVPEKADVPAQRTETRAKSSLMPLDELISHWEGTHIPDPTVQLGTKSDAHATFRAYQQALGEGVNRTPGPGTRFVRSRQPEKKAILWFVAALTMLRKGERARAAQHLAELTKLYPNFPDPWVWLSATTDDPAQRIDYLENAVLLEPAHPLARDALAIAQGKVAPSKAAPDGRESQRIKVSKCPQCGGSLHYEPGAREVACQYCGHRLILQGRNLINEEARLVGDLQLQRRIQGHTWREVQRTAHCQACGAELSMTHYLARQCVFCGSTSVLLKDSQQRLEQPDGFLPFKLDEGEAGAAIDRAQRSTAQRLKTWWSGREQVIEGLQAIYLPYWVFDGFVEVRKPAAGWLGQPEWRGYVDGSWRSRRLASTPAEHESGVAKELMMFENLVFPAMLFPPPWLLKQVLPYELGALVPYEPRLLASWPAALYDRDVEVAVKDAYDAMLSTAAWRKRSVVVANASELRQLRHAFQVTSVTYQLVLLPVWVALAQRDKDQRLVLVNGQTGQVTFSSPIRSKT
jgi:DNA-directed RNA polymerase subunit RPC12/RpoP